LIGLTEEVLSDIEDLEKRKRRREGKKADLPIPTPLYQQVTVLKEFNFKPAEWKRLTRTDKKALYYYMIMHNYFVEKEMEGPDVKIEPDASDSFMSKMPQQAIPRQRGRR